MSERRTWLWVLIASVIALAIGFGAAWMIQQQKVADATAAAALSKARLDSATRDLADKEIALTDALDAQKALEAKVASLTASAAATPTAKPKPKPSAGFTGDRFGFIKKFETKGGTTYVTIDRAEFLTGKAAAAAATAHGDESPPPNDYYIVNDNRALTTYPVAPGASVRLTTGPSGSVAIGYPSDLATLKKIFRGSVTGNLAYAKQQPYWLYIGNGTVAAFKEQYLP